MIIKQNMQMQIKHIESGKKQYRIHGCAMPFDTPDIHNEIFKKGSFLSSIQKMKEINFELPMLFNHKADCMIGSWKKIYETDKGLFADGVILLNTDYGMKVAELIDEGMLTGLSIGFIPVHVNAKIVPKTFYSVDLKELSVVTMPAQDWARITKKDDDIAMEIGEKKSDIAY